MFKSRNGKSKKAMNKEKIVEELIRYGEKLETKEYFIVLTSQLASSYYKYFTKGRIMKTLKGGNYNSTIMPLTSISNLDYKSAYYLNYQEHYTLNIDQSSYIVFDLKGMVKKVVINHQKQFLPLIPLEEVLEILKKNKIEVDREEIESFKESIYLKSLIYSYATELLVTKYTDTERLTRAGMFQNAYHNLITFQSSSFLPFIEPVIRK